MAGETKLFGRAADVRVPTCSRHVVGMTLLCEVCGNARRCAAGICGEGLMRRHGSRMIVLAFLILIGIVGQAEATILTFDGWLGQLSLVAAPGFLVHLNSFDLAGFTPCTNCTNQPVRVLDGSNNVLVDDPHLALLPTHSDF